MGGAGSGRYDKHTEQYKIKRQQELKRRREKKQEKKNAKSK